jgi:hypothetical protein
VVGLGWVDIESSLAAGILDARWRPGWSRPYGTGDVNQFDSFLQPCPITFRMEFIPAGY